MQRLLFLRNLPVATIALISLCVILFIFTEYIQSATLVNALYISNFPTIFNLPEVRAGQLWRLITPTFLHFGEIHIVFNMIWLWLLGGALEYRNGSATLIWMVLIIGVLSNLAEYYYSQPRFGGMSGVVYGMLSYIWIMGKLNPRFGLALQKEIAIWMVAWLAIGWLDIIPGIRMANMAHTGGLLTGLVWGFIHSKLVK